MEKHINSVEEVDASKLTFADLRWKYSTGETYTEKRGGKKFEYYIPGVMTEIGDIRRDVWEKLMYDLIVRSGEEELYRQMYAWFKDGVMYYSSEAETKKSCYGRIRSGCLMIRNGATTLRLIKSIARGYYRI